MNFWFFTWPPHKSFLLYKYRFEGVFFHTEIFPWCISSNAFIDVQYHADVLDIFNSITDILKSLFGYPNIILF